MISGIEDWKRLTLKRDGVCATCDTQLKAGSAALWSTSRRIISCIVHADKSNARVEQVKKEVKEEPQLKTESSLSQGTAGGSANAESERRIKRREERITAKFPRAGKYILALTDEPQSTKAWKVGAEGEIAVGKFLDSLAIEYGFQVLHDRLIPKSRANIDHIAITKAGVFVIDAKNYKGVIEIRDKSGFFEKSAPELWVGKRNRMNLITGMKKQTSIIDGILRSNSIDIPVIGVLTFYDAEWETFSFLRKQEEVEGVLLNTKGIEAILSRDGLLSLMQIDATASLLATVLLPAP